MLRSIIEDIKREFGYGNTLTRIIIINIIVFVIINILNIVTSIINSGVPYDITRYFCFSSDPWLNLTRPWTLLTSIFLHENFFHILWNMLFLYWFGRIVADFIGNHRILPLFLMGGFVGLLLFMLAMQVPFYNRGVAHYALGASGGVMAIVVAAGVLVPNYLINVFLIGEVKLKYVVLTLVFLDMISISNMDNTGGHFAHLGGALVGWVYVKRLRSGQDLAAPFYQLFTWIERFYNRLVSSIRQEEPPIYTHTQKRQKRSYTTTASSAKATQKAHQMADDDELLPQQDRIDRILDKIKEKGYENLTAEEKEFLFNASNQ